LTKFFMWSYVGFSTGLTPSPANEKQIKLHG
jgi:hypothetical protein